MRLVTMHRVVIAMSMAMAAACATVQNPAQTTVTEEATAVALRHLRAILARDWTASAELTHPAELARNRAMFEAIFARDTTRFLQLRVLELPSTASLSDLSDVEFNARLFAFHVGVGMRGSALDRVADADVFAVALPHPDTAFVIWQWRLPGERPIRSAEALKLQRDQNRWWLNMLADFEGLRESLQQ